MRDLVPSSFTLTGVRIYTPHFLAGADTLVVDRGVIAEIGPRGDVTTRGEVLDLDGMAVAPGYLDLQVNGSFGIDVMTAEVSALHELAAQLPRFGCTGFLPTVVTADRSRLARALGAIAEAGTTIPRRAIAGGRTGARLLGAHLEGPYLAVDYAGAHPREHIRPFDWQEWSELWQAARETIRLVTLAPEIPANRAAIPRLVEAGVVVSAGHTGATYDEIVDAVGVGLRMMTHLGNAMRGFHHRDPGPIGAAFDQPLLAACVIADGIHVHPQFISIVRQLKGADGVIAVTDAAWMTGLQAGTYSWEGRVVRYDGRAPYLEDGRLAGSGLTMDVAVANLVRSSGFSVEDALCAVTRNPARALRLSPLGKLRPGAAADLVVLDDRLGVSATFVDGVLAYRHPTSPLPDRWQT